MMWQRRQVEANNCHTHTAIYVTNSQLIDAESLTERKECDKRQV